MEIYCTNLLEKRGREFEGSKHTNTEKKVTKKVVEATRKSTDNVV